MEKKTGWRRVVRAALAVIWLGLGGAANAQSPISGATQVAAGGSHTCALIGGGVKCWGDNAYGQLGDSTTVRRLTAVDVVGLATGAIAVAAGRSHTCALSVSGGVKCWGDNSFGQLGDNSTAQRLTAVDVTGLTSGVMAIAAGEQHTCALTTSGGVKCWGWNASGQLGDNSTSQRLIAVDAIGVTGGISALVTGSWHTCALTIGGGVKCWGSNAGGQLGDNSSTDRHAQVDVAGLTSGAASIAAGKYHTCARTTSGGIKCWGDNSFGQLGDNSTSQRLTAVDVTGMTTGVAAVSAGFSHTCALTALGQVKCWGDNGHGELGDATTTRSSVAVDVVGFASGIAAISVGAEHSCALTTDGGIKCWGYNGLGQLGDNSTSERLIAVDVTGLASGVVTVATGYYHTCALTVSGGVKCWGKNDTGQLGVNSTDQRLIAGDVSGLTSGVTTLAVGGNHACALTAGNGVKCWGHNGYGQLGDNSTTDRLTAVDVAGLTSGVATVVTGLTHSCALTSAGGVKCWGYNAYGQLGDTTTIQRPTPVDVVGLTSGVAAIAAGGNHTCALTTGGGVKCWGGNYYGQLGDNSTTQRLAAADALGLTGGVAAISAGQGHSCALTTGGGVKCWGDNSGGQLGDSSTTQRLLAVDVTGLTSGIAAISAGAGHSCALTLGGGVKCWGTNHLGQLGDNSAIQRLTATDVTGLTSGVVVVATRNGHTCARTTVGGIKCWGYNGYGQLGDGTITSASALPVTSLQASTAGVPLAVIGTAGNTQVSLAWTAPVSNGGSAITGYNVQVATSAGGAYANVGSGSCAPTTANVSTATTCTVTGLINGVTYYFKVAAINSLGVGSYSGASSGVTPMPAVVSPPPPVVPPLPVTVLGVNGTPSIANLTSNDGPAFLAAMTGMLNNALSSSLQFVEQTAQGTVVLHGYQGGSLAFMPHSYQAGDTRANGIYPLGDGRYQVVSNGSSLTIAPALRSLDQLVALLPSAQVVQGDNGVLTAYFGGVAYVVQPSIQVLSVPASGSPRLLAGTDGYYHFIDAQGNEQILYPAFREPGVLRAALLQIDPVASLLLNLDGTATAQVFGRSWTLIPDLVLVPVPDDRLGQAWWQESSARYRYANSQFQPVSGMSQGLALR